MRTPRVHQSILYTGFILAAALLGSGCIHQPQMLLPNKQVLIDRKVIEYPSGSKLQIVVKGLNSPTAMAWDEQGALLVAESGIDNTEPHIFGYRKDGTYFQVYPFNRNVTFAPTGFVMYGPIGGLACYQGKVYVSHRDRNDKGVISALDYQGRHNTIVADLPAQGEHGVTAMAVGPNGRLYFGVGSATNSGVVGVDDWDAGWLKSHNNVCDVPYKLMPGWYLYLLGRRFDTPNPRAGLFGASIAVTAPYQPYGTSNKTRIVGSDKPNGAVFSVAPDGGDLRVEAYGIHLPRGLAFNEYGRLYMTNDGMEMRGTRPVKDDPDALLRVVTNTWYGWPDYSADLLAINEARFQPPQDLIIRTGYPDLSFSIDHETSGLTRPDRNTLLFATFPSLAGAAGMDFVPASGGFRELRGSAIVALSGDRWPFATSGEPLLNRSGFKLVRVDIDNKRVYEFIHNTAGVPASMQRADTLALERPIDVKFGPDGAMYILDFGEMSNKTGEPRVFPGTGKIFRLSAVPEPNSQPAGNAGN